MEKSFRLNNEFAWDKHDWILRIKDVTGQPSLPGKWLLRGICV